VYGVRRATHQDSAGLGPPPGIDDGTARQDAAVLSAVVL
jgi:hypothetical protein